MLYDGFCPEVLKGRGQIKCSFKNMPLLPGLYSVQMGVRAQTTFEDIVKAKDIGFFNITGSMSEAGFKGENAEQILTGSTQLIIPYQWTLPNGEQNQFKIKTSLSNVRRKL
jgi:lipopolysaccharide transport system ATP-binding protein